MLKDALFPAFAIPLRKVSAKAAGFGFRMVLVEVGRGAWLHGEGLQRVAERM
jgi:hypothetical protein